MESPTNRHIGKVYYSHSLERTKKRRKVCFDSMPFDCWGHILLFMSSSKDFLALLGVVKGFYGYLNASLCTTSSKNIMFKLKNIPTEEKRFVSNIRYQPEKGEDFFEKFNCSEIGHIYDRVLKKCPNLRTLYFHFGNISLHYISRVTEFFRPMGPEKMNMLKVKFNITLSTLRKVHLIVRGVSLDFEPPLLPKLEILILERGWESGEKLRRDTLRASYDLNFPNDLATLPCLRVLSLHGWRLRNHTSSGNVQKIQKIFFLQSFFKEPDISNMENLEVLSLSGVLAITRVRKIENLPLLKKLYICNCKGAERTNHLRVSFSTSLPNLVFLEITIHGNSVYFGGRMFEINEDTFPSLSSVVIRTSKESTNFFPIAIQHKKVKGLRINFWKNVLSTSEASLSNIDRLELIGIGDSQINSKISQLLVSENMLKNITFICIINWASEILERAIPVRNFEFLIRLTIRDRLVSEIRGCPSLTEFEIFPTSNFVLDPKPNSLKKVCSEFVSSSQSIENFTSQLQDVATKLKFAFYESMAPVIAFNGKDFNQNTEELKFGFCNKGYWDTKVIRVCEGIDRNISIKIEDFMILKKISIELVDTSLHFPRDIVIKNIPFLELLDLNSNLSSPNFSTDLEHLKPSRIHLEDLPRCKKLVVGIGYTSVDDVTIKNVDINTLVVCLSYLKEEEFNHGLKEKLHIDGLLFPGLHKISVGISRGRLKREDSGYGFSRIGCLANLSRLRKVEIHGTHFNKTAPFCKVENMDLLGVRIFCQFFEEESMESGGGETTMRERAFLLKDYIEIAKNRGMM